ncbi:hypothetical protein Tco_0690977 [Tanacetum coccineum]
MEFISMPFKERMSSGRPGVPLTRVVTRKVTVACLVVNGWGDIGALLGVLRYKLASVADFLNYLFGRFHGLSLSQSRVRHPQLCGPADRKIIQWFVLVGKYRDYVWVLVSVLVSARCALMGSCCLHLCAMVSIMPFISPHDDKILTPRCKNEEPYQDLWEILPKEITESYTKEITWSITTKDTGSYYPKRYWDVLWENGELSLLEQDMGRNGVSGLYRFSAMEFLMCDLLALYLMVNQPWCTNFSWLWVAKLAYKGGDGGACKLLRWLVVKSSQEERNVRKSNIGDSDNTRDGGKIVGGAIRACGGIVARRTFLDGKSSYSLGFTLVLYNHEL